MRTDLIQPNELIEKYSKELNGFEEEFEIIFNDKSNLLSALDHTVANSEKKKQYALAGDALLDFLLFEYLLEKGGYTKGKMDCIRQALNTDLNLARIGRKMGLKKYIIFPDSATEEEKYTGDAYYHDTVEALVFMIHQGQEINTTKNFVKKHIFSEIPIDEYRCKNEKSVEFSRNKLLT